MKNQISCKTELIERGTKKNMNLCVKKLQVADMLQGYRQYNEVMGDEMRRNEVKRSRAT